MVPNGYIYGRPKFDPSHTYAIFTAMDQDLSQFEPRLFPALPPPPKTNTCPKTKHAHTHTRRRDAPTPTASAKPLKDSSRLTNCPGPTSAAVASGWQSQAILRSFQLKFRLTRRGQLNRSDANAFPLLIGSINIWRGTRGSN